jgi:signal transduction histidine kinase
MLPGQLPVRFAVAFVAVVLLALFLVPATSQWRVGMARGEIEAVAEPARDALSEVQYLLARQMSSLRGFLITGDSTELEQFERLASRQQQIFPQLQSSAVALSAEAHAATVELRTLATQWHTRVGAAALTPSPGVAPGPDAFFEAELYFRTLEAAGRADLAVRAASGERWEEMRRLESFARGLTFLLGALALAGLGTLGWLTGRTRRLALDAESNRLESERAAEETARAIAMRADMIRGFTHDVKNPLGAADGYADLLDSGLQGELTPQQGDAVRRIRSSIQGAIEIIDELLDLSRLESGGIRLAREPTDLAFVVREAAWRHQGAARTAGLELDFVGSEEPLVAFTDPTRVHQVLDNLISNARKYTPPPGRIVLDLQGDGPEPPPRPGNWVAIRVSDTGPGVPEEEQERIFDEFHRVPGAPGRGHGLGLAISRRIARALGGDVTVRSVLGRGATFILWIPVRALGDGEDPPPEPT